MRHKLSLSIALGLLLTSGGFAQGPASAVEKLDQLRLELIDVQAQEEFLRTRAEQLEEAMKPQNIERSLAGVGSTKPEELREFRRQQLERERQLILTQLEAAVAKRARLQSEITQLEVRAYHESAQPSPVSPLSQALIAGSPAAARALFIGLISGAFAMVGGAIFLIRRMRRNR